MSTSSSDSGDGVATVAPTKPVTPGVLRTADQDGVVELHPDQDVAGQHLALDLLALAVLDLGDLFGRHLDLEDEVLHVQGLDPGLEVGLDLVLVAGVGVHDVPVAGRAAQRGAQLRDRVDLDLLGLGSSASASSSVSASPSASSSAARRRRRRRRRRLAVGVASASAVVVGRRRRRGVAVVRRLAVGRSSSSSTSVDRLPPPFSGAHVLLASFIDHVVTAGAAAQVSRTGQHALARTRVEPATSATMKATKTSTTIV